MQQLKHETTIKRLRAAAKETDATVARLQEQLSEAQQTIARQTDELKAADRARGPRRAVRRRYLQCPHLTPRIHPPAPRPQRPGPRRWPPSRRI